MEVLTGHNWTLYVADCRAAMAVMPERSVHCVVSSPPYWGLRDYGIPPVDWEDGERCVFGLEATVAGYIRHTLEIFDGLRRVLRDDGVIWWNIGDSFITGAGKAKKAGGGKQGENFAGPSSQANRMPQDGIPSGSKGLIPHRVAIALCDAGWVIRQDNVWSKRTAMPESMSGWRWVQCSTRTSRAKRAKPGTRHAEATFQPQGARNGKDFDSAADREVCPGCSKCEATGGFVLRRGSWRTTNAHEFIFMVTKGGNYFSDSEAVAEEAVGGTPGNKNHKQKEKYDAGDRMHRRAAGLCNMTARKTRNPRSVWSLVNEPYKAAHFACFPTEVPRRCIQASTSSVGVCPACGSQYAPVCETSREATRPGCDSKVGRASDKPDSPYNGHNGPVVGNRDPQRHVTVTAVLGHRPSCSCDAGPPVPATVLDIFNGSGTTGQVAVSLGRRYVGCEINPTYARELAAVRIETPLPDKTKPAKKRSRRHKHQKQLFTS